MTSVASCVIF